MKKKDSVRVKFTGHFCFDIENENVSDDEIDNIVIKYANELESDTKNFMCLDDLEWKIIKGV